MNLHDEAVRLLTGAVASRTAIAPLTDTIGAFDAAEGYQIQDAVVRARVGGGHQVVGAKLGLTSAAKQRQMNVDRPLYGWLTADMQVDVGQALVCADFIQPRCEPEVAFLLAHDLEGPHITTSHVLAATDAVFPAVDILDSRYAGYKFTLEDVIADNSSSAGFVVGGNAIDPRGVDLARIGVVLELNGQVKATGSGAAVLGHPAASVAWLVRELASRDRGLSKGQIIMSGAITEAVAVTPGDSVVARFDRLGSVEIACR